jgi:hypothetical protein
MTENNDSAVVLYICTRIYEYALNVLFFKGAWTNFVSGVNLKNEMVIQHHASRNISLFLPLALCCQSCEKN